MVLSRESDNELVANIDVAETEPETNETEGVLFTNVYRGEGVFNTYAKDNQSTKVLLINSKEELNTLWFDLFKDTLATPKPKVNFDNQSVIIAMLDRKNQGGYQLTIRSIIEEDEKLVVKGEEKTPGNGCATNVKNNRPVHVVITEKSSAVNAELDLDTVSAAPCSVKLLEV